MMKKNSEQITAGKWKRSTKNCPSRKVVTNRKAVNPVSVCAPPGEHYQGLGSVAVDGGEVPHCSRAAWLDGVAFEPNVLGRVQVLEPPTSGEQSILPLRLVRGVASGQQGSGST